VLFFMCFGAQPLKIFSKSPSLLKTAVNCATHLRSLLDYDGKADLVGTFVAKARQKQSTSSSKSAAIAEHTSDEKSQLCAEDKSFGEFFASLLKGGSAVSMEVRFRWCACASVS
jgi:hypothetical protein